MELARYSWSPTSPPGGVAPITLRCLPLKGTRDVTAKVANYLDKVTAVSLELVPSRKCLDPQEPVTSSQMSLWMKSRDALERGRCLFSLAL